MLAAQIRVELLLTLRRGESLLVAFGLPVGLLVFFSVVDVLPTQGSDPIRFLLPGMASIGVMATAMLGLGIATGYERQNRVLKRLGSTPLGRPRLIAAKAGSILVVEVVQVGILVAAAAALGWRAGPLDPIRLLMVLMLGTAAFAGLGLALAGRLRAEANLAVANAVFLVLLLLGGSLVEVARLPGLLGEVARLTPATALTEAFRGAFGAGETSLLRLLGWAVATPVAAALLFRWE